MCKQEKWHEMESHLQLILKGFQRRRISLEIDALERPRALDLIWYLDRTQLAVMAARTHWIWWIWHMPWQVQGLTSKYVGCGKKTQFLFCDQQDTQISNMPLIRSARSWEISPRRCRLRSPKVWNGWGQIDCYRIAEKGWAVTGWAETYRNY